MTIRSTPPASWHLAESPTPAPPPTIGSPRAAIARNFSTKADRSNLIIVASRPAPKWISREPRDATGTDGQTQYCDSLRVNRPHLRPRALQLASHGGDF